MEASPANQAPARIGSIDAMRGFVMFLMICVNDITYRQADAQETIPHWLRHYEKSASGMTFVDVVFPAFLFLVGMSIPFAIGSRIKKGVAIWRILVDIVVRTLSLLLIGVFMVNDAFDSKTMGWPDSLWSTLMYVFAILAFCTYTLRKSAAAKWNWGAIVFLGLRIVGFIGLIVLALVFRGENGRRMVTLWPFSVQTAWFGILGLIGWAYLMAATAYLIFRDNRTALLGCAVLLMCLYPATHGGKFDHWWLAGHVAIGTMLGTQGAIAMFGVLLATILRTADTAALWPRVRFTLFLILGLCIGAVLLKFNKREWGINKMKATPAWALWSSAITAGVWLVFYFVCDVSPARWVAKPFAIAGQNVLLAYLLYNLMNPAIWLAKRYTWYEHLAEPDLAHALGRAAGSAVVILTITALLNRVGFRLRI
jgi:heparan-alpha-glucosaminide N-acetyltransferase